MKTQKIKKASVIVIAVLMITGSNLYAQRGRNYSNQGNGYNQYQTCQRIPDLTDDQITKIEALRVTHLKEITTHRNEMNEFRAKKQTLMTSDNADMKEIDTVIDQMTSLRNKQQKIAAKHQQEIRSQLTDSQKIYFNSRPMNRRGSGNKAGRGGRGNRQGMGQNSGCGNGMYQGSRAGLGRGNDQ